MNNPFQYLAALLLVSLTPLRTTYCSSSPFAQAFGCHTSHTRPSARRRHPTATSRWSTIISFGRSHIMNQAAANDSNNDYSNDSNDNNNRNDVIEKMRNYLESSWNIQTMGTVPSTPENAAEAAAQSIQSAKSDGIQQMMVNILLPSYDITQGEQFYDEILAAQFCISLSKHLQDLFPVSSCTVLLRNGKAERYARRALTVDDTSNTKVIIQDDKDDDSPSNLSRDGDNDTGSDDNGDATNETERFRQQLLRLEASMAWKNDSIENSNDTRETQASSIKEEENSNDKKTLESDGATTKDHVQLSSLLGDEAISKGTDMADDVIQAVTKRFRQSASHASNTDVVIILSSFSPEDMVAVRRLLQLYEGKETLFVLVNCKLNPIPRELLRSEVVYSLLPLTLRERSPQSTWINKQQQNQKNDYENTIKVIVLRRYPQGWDIFIDRNGSGFTLANTVPANPMERNGPSMERIAALVENYLKQTVREDGTIKQKEEDEDDNILQ